MRFRLNGVRIMLKGIKDKVSRCDAISMQDLQALTEQHVMVHVVQLASVQAMPTTGGMLAVSAVKP